MSAAADVHQVHLELPAEDGLADAYFTHPAGPGPFPAVLMFMDAIGLRPRLREMADRIARQGYAVLVPNLFYRSGRAPVLPDLLRRIRDDRAGALADLRPHMEDLTPRRLASDVRSYIAFLDDQPAVASGPLAAVGYCMGGALALAAAAELPGRVVAAASFHGGNLAPAGTASRAADLGRITAEVYVAHADRDQSMPNEQIVRLEERLSAAGVAYTSVVYQGAVHGFTMADLPAHDDVAEERHWQALLELLGRTLPVQPRHRETGEPLNR